MQVAEVCVGTTPPQLHDECLPDSIVAHRARSFGCAASFLSFVCGYFSVSNFFGKKHPRKASKGKMSSHKLKLLGPTMFRSFRCVWMLEELGLEFEHDLSATPWSEKAKECHPMGKIPSLVVDDVETNNKSSGNGSSPPFIMHESSAINTFLGRLAGRKDLVPDGSDMYRQARYDQIVSMIMSEMDAQALWIHRKHVTLGHTFGKADEAVIKTAKDQFKRTNRALASQLNPYLLGDDFSAADMLYVHCLDWAEGIGWKGEGGGDNNNACWFDDDGQEDLSGLSSRIETYLERCRQRPAYKATLARQQVEKDAYKKKKSNKGSKL
uniref:Glutathione transferase n=1 Tax=Grammatophora oceanica TaxID=210454 RepID=A0A7S1URH3_9STRA